MIPKIIHYCWFGFSPISQEEKKCIKSWKKHCNNYRIIEWNENNFDFSSAPLYVRQAYKAKKWAFVSDYVRLWALCNHGGIYLDTDVELLKSPDDLLAHRAFLFFETTESISTGFIGCEKNYPLFLSWMYTYKNKSFFDEYGQMDLTINVLEITKLCYEYGVTLNDELQDIKGLMVYPMDYLFSRLPGRADITSKTYAIHYFSNSWKSSDESFEYDQKMMYLKNRLIKQRRIQKIKNWLYKFISD